MGDQVAVDEPRPALGHRPLFPEARALGVLDRQVLGVVEVDSVVDMAVAVQLVGPDRPADGIGERIDGHRSRL